jgi:RND family efflux transporter MFP subunit
MKIPKIFNINLRKINKIWIIAIIIILIIIGYYVVKSVFKSPTDGLVIEKIQKGSVLQEVSETGSIRATEDISLGFKSIGRISEINVSVGENVKKGDVLAKLDLSQTSAQLQSAKAALDSAKTEYDKLVNGLTQEDIKTYQNAVTSAKDDLQGVYNSSRNTLNNAYTKIYNSYTTVVSLQNDYFGPMDQSGIKVLNSRNDINTNMQDIKKYLDGDIDIALSRMTIALDNIYNDLKIVREQCDEGAYYSTVSAAYKTTIDTQKEYINTASTSITTSQQDVNSYKIALQKAEDNLALKTANARPEDIDIYKASISQAQANVDALQSQLNDNYLASPINGKITDINMKRGQIVSPSQSVIDLLSTEPFQIKVNIYEQDIVNVKVGNSVKINLVAFQKENFTGKVLSIDPAETIVDNVLYYEVTIDFSNQPEGVRSGMTADIVIETNKKDNVLKIPKNAVSQIEGIDTVQVLKGNKIENRTIILGLEGNDYLEVVSGLKEGDQIITGKK